MMANEDAAYEFTQEQKDTIKRVSEMNALFWQMVKETKALRESVKELEERVRELESWQESAHDIVYNKVDDR